MLDIRFSPPAAASLEGAPPSEPSSPSPAAGEAEEEAEDDEAAAEPLPSSPPRRPAAAVSGGGLVPALAEPSPPSAWRGRTNTTASKQTRQTWSVTKQEPWAEGGRGTRKREHVIAAYGGKVSRGARRQHTLEKNVKEKKKTVEARVACWWMGTSKAPEAARRTEGRAMQLANGGRTVKPRHRPNSYVQLPSCLAAQEPNGTEPAGQTTATKGKRNEGARRSQSAATITNTAAFAPT